jgi:AraC-like DNA-binding protein
MNDLEKTGAPTDAAWTPVDPLGEALHFLRMSSVFYTRSEFSAPWALALPPMPGCLMFHMVTTGECRLLIDGSEDRLLQPGDFVLVPHGAGHQLCSAPDVAAADLFSLPRESVSERYDILRHGGGGTAATMVCGAVRFDHPAARQLLALLPQVIAMQMHDSAQQGWIQGMLELMAAEAEALRPGGETVITRLADVLVIYTLRSWLDADPAAQSGWLGALQDRHIGRAILLMQREPARAWTVATLATAVAMSRSAFSARFKQLVGDTPMTYLARWRMHIAVSWLKDEAATVGSVASRLGYDSEAAFSRAFKRCIGLSPGSVRREAAP